MKYLKILFSLLAVIAISTSSINAQYQVIQSPIQKTIQIETQDIIVHDRSAFESEIIVHKFM